MKDAYKLLDQCYSQCVRASRQPWDLADHGAVILASAMFYVKYGYRFPALERSTVEMVYERMVMKQELIKKIQILGSSTTPSPFRTIYDVIFALIGQGAILTGSRAFGFERNESDWDFIISEERFNSEHILWKETATRHEY